MAISFNNQHPLFNNIPQSKGLISWLQKAAEEEGFSIGQLNYTFCSDATLLAINQKFLQHDTYTDIITFDYNQDHLIIGEIYMSLDRIEENARINLVPFHVEFSRILVHGLLHLMGYHDKKPNEKVLMTQKEDYYLSLQPQIN